MANKKSKNTTYHTRKAAGLCPSCGKPASLGRVHCVACRLKNALRMRSQYAARILDGLCGLCGAWPKVAKASKCEQCDTKQVSRRRLRETGCDAELYAALLDAQEGVCAICHTHEIT